MDLLNLVLLARGKFLSKCSRGWQIINEVVVIVVVNVSDLKAVWFFLGTCSADFGGVVNVSENFLFSLALQLGVSITTASKILCFKAIYSSRVFLVIFPHTLVNLFSETLSLEKNP